MSDRMMKGQDTQLLMFTIVILSVVVGLLSFSQMLAAPGILASALDDPPMVVEAQTRSDNIVAHYLPLAAHYSVAQGAWDESISSENIMTNGSFSDHFRWTIENASSKSDRFFETHYLDSDGFNVGRCDIDIPHKNLIIEVTSSSIQVEKNRTSEPLVRTECSEGQNKVLNVLEESGSVNTPIEVGMSNIDLHKLLFMTMNGTKAAYDRARELDNNNNHYGTAYHDTGSRTPPNCGPTKQNALNTARIAAETKAEDKLDDIIPMLKGVYDGNISSISTSGGTKVFLGTTYTFSAAWESNPFSWTPSLVENQTIIDLKSNSTSKCQCVGTFTCPGNQWQKYSSGGNLNCAHVNSTTIDNSIQATCGHEDFDASDGKCDINDYGAPVPTPNCTSGTFDPGNDKCSGSSVTPYCNDSLDGDNDNDWKYDSDNGDCEWNGTNVIPTPYCTQGGVTHDGNGECEAPPSNSPPSPSCNDWSYSAEAEYYWEMSNFTLRSKVEGRSENPEIPVDDSYKRLAVNRTFNYSFSGNNRP